MTSILQNHFSAGPNGGATLKWREDAPSWLEERPDGYTDGFRFSTRRRIYLHLANVAPPLGPLLKMILEKLRSWARTLQYNLVMAIEENGERTKSPQKIEGTD